MSFIDDALATLGAVAPGIATALGGPVAGLAVQAIEGAFGLSSGGDKNAALQAIAGATPDQIMALKKADQDFQVRMKELEIDIYKTDAGDRDSARKRQMAIKDWVPGALAICLTLGFFGLLAYLVRFAPPPESRDILNIMLGSLGTGWVTMLSYYFGSSSGADHATKLLSQAPAIGGR